MEALPVEEPYEDALEDSLAPLKRNHACLQCKKRKVKCDGTRPHCAPCQRSHAHAIRAASRAGMKSPLIGCDWADSDSPGTSPIAVTKKKTSGKKVPLEKEKARRQEDEKDVLLARIAELEARLAGLTPPSSEGSGSRFTNPSPVEPAALAPELDWDFSDFLLVPSNWPRNLPAPYLLDHLIDTFFNAVPQLPRILNRAKLMASIRLPPNHPSFPHPSLLHAICAAAAQYTAWVTSLPLHTLNAAVQSRHARGETLENFEDFPLAQAESAHRSIQQTHEVCTVGSPTSLLEIMQAEVLISDVWICRGLYLKGWSNGGQVARYARGLELTNRNHPRRYKSSILQAPENAVDREERASLVWHAFQSEAFSGVGRYWPISLDDRDMFCKLPAASVGKGDIMENPQDAKDQRLYSDHPVHDTFVLNCKTAMLCSRTARFIRDWAQREVRPGDEMLGMQLQLFRDLVRDINTFQQTIPDVFKNIFRLQAGVINSELLALHVMPNIALLMLYEPFADWDQPQLGGVQCMLAAYEGIMGILHLIPSNVDVSYILTSDLAFNIHSLGRIIIDFIQHALEKQAYGLAVRYRTDLTAVQSLLARFGAKHPLGAFSLTFLNNYLEAAMKGEELSGLTGCSGSSGARGAPATANSEESAGMSEWMSVGMEGDV